LSKSISSFLYPAGCHSMDEIIFKTSVVKELVYLIHWQKKKKKKKKKKKTYINLINNKINIFYYFTYDGNCLNYSDEGLYM